MRSLTLAPRFGLEVGLTIDVEESRRTYQEIAGDFYIFPPGADPKESCIGRNNFAMSCKRPRPDSDGEAL